MILLDEIETTFHPLWQKKFINIIIRFINEIRKKNLIPQENEYHLIFVTHSPFILSDIPRENIIFLDKYKKEDIEVKNGNQLEGNCKQIKGLKEKKQTFGANIHTLLSDSFFMEDGLMGEFAKDKINDVYNFIVHDNTNKIKTKEEAKKIIDIIGDTLVKRQLEELYNQKFNEPSKDEIIESLRKEIESLKAKNDSD